MLWTESCRSMTKQSEELEVTHGEAGKKSPDKELTHANPDKSISRTR